MSNSELRPTRLVRVALLLTAFALGCPDESQPGEKLFFTGDVPDVVPTDVLAVSDPGQPDPGPDISTGDVPGRSTCEPGTGCFGEPCAGNDDCQSGFCVEHLGETVCSKFCYDDCPAGWSCKQVSMGGPDLVFVCVSDAAFLCWPCNSNDDCKAAWGGQAVCVDYGNSGSFCGTGCGEGSPCPDGFECKDVLSVSGAPTTQCVMPSGGDCPCSKKATELALSTECRAVNEHGTCIATRVCTADGLTACTAPTPAPEVCNGLDDDCDGTADGDLAVPCDDGDPCTKDTCAGADGCQTAPLSGVPCDDENVCTSSDFCNGGVCSGAPVECDDDDLCTDDACDPAAGCVHPFNSAPCDDGDPCTLGDHCTDGGCKGEAVFCECETAADCEVLDDGNACNGTLFCDKSKVPYGCKVSPGTEVVCPKPTGVDAFCRQAVCDPATGGCSEEPAHDGAACSDADSCTVGDMCMNGKCAPQAYMICDDSNPCTMDNCVSLKGCVYKPGSGSCTDGNVCTLGDHCEGGVCVGSEALVCDDGNVCTTDSCNPAKGCVTTPNTAPCDDGDACTFGDTCGSFACKPGKAVKCDDGNVCTDEVCEPKSGCIVTPNESACDDGNACTSGDHCSGGACVPAEAIECDDGNVCTTDTCKPGGGCVHLPNTAPCDDGDACTVGDKCKVGACVGGPAAVCNDFNVCTKDTCDPETGCVLTPVEGGCHDGNACTDGDACMDGLCMPGGAKDCDDGEVCTTDVCNPATGCKHVPNTAPCDDNDLCTVGDACSGGACKPGPTASCDDKNSCTDDTCQADTGCIHVPNSEPCTDGNECTTGDMCIGGWCKGTGTLTCDDGEVCTYDFCHSDKGCVHENNQALCSDGNACTVGDACKGGACQAGPGKLACDDAKPCTKDSCDAKKGCVFDLFSPCCGNEVVDFGEKCDDGNNTGGDGCSADCKSDEKCGNGLLDPATEICDGLIFPADCKVGQFHCLDQCKTWNKSNCQSWCGDGKIDPKYEACDPGVFPVKCDDGEFQCVADCKIWDKSTCNAWCGDGVAQPWEQCDGLQFNATCPVSGCTCSVDCAIYAVAEQGQGAWAAGSSDGVSTAPQTPLDPACKDPSNLCLDASKSELEHIWIANSNHHEIVRINVATGAVEKQIPSGGRHPSRTAVVIADGSVWVGNRAYSGTEYTNGAYSNLAHFDKEGNLICKTPITGMVRAVGIDGNGDVWGSSWVEKKMYQVSGTEKDGTTCKVKKVLDTGGCGYGAAADSKGNMWVANNCNWASDLTKVNQSLQRIHVPTQTFIGNYAPPSSLASCFNTYGITVDAQGRVLIGAYACTGLFRFTPETSGWEWISTKGAGTPRGVVVDQNGFIFSAISNVSLGGGDARRVVRVAPDFKSFTTLELPSGITHPVGVAIDRNGKLWTAGRNSDTAARIEIASWGASPKVDVFPTEGDDPYTYSDMTGFQFLMFTNPEGTWTQTYDGGADAIHWKLVEWQGIEEPGVTDISVRARSAATKAALDAAGWTGFFTDSPAKLDGLPTLRWLQLQVRLSSTNSDKTPILQKVAVHWAK